MITALGAREGTGTDITDPALDVMGDETLAHLGSLSSNVAENTG